MKSMEIKKNSHVQWIDALKPSERDLAWLEEKFKLHPVIVDELRTPSARAMVEHYDGYLYLIYYFPIYDPTDAASVRSEIDFIITKDSVVTVHYEKLSDSLGTFGLSDERDTLELVHGIIGHLLTFEDRQLRHIREKVELVGRDIFKDKEKEVLERITYLKRDISEYRIVVRLQEPILKSLISVGQMFWGEAATVYLNDLMGDQLKLVSQLEDCRETVSDFEDTNNQLMNLKINTVMKTFTLLSFLTFPFMLIATLFGMNTRDTPLVGVPNAFWIVVSGMVATMAILIVYFKKKKWF